MCLVIETSQEVFFWRAELNLLSSVFNQWIREINVKDLSLKKNPSCKCRLDTVMPLRIGHVKMRSTSICIDIHLFFHMSETDFQIWSRPIVSSPRHRRIRGAGEATLQLSALKVSITHNRHSTSNGVASIYAQRRQFLNPLKLCKK